MENIWKSQIVWNTQDPETVWIFEATSHLIEMV